MNIRWMALALVGGCAVSAGAVDVTMKDSDVKLQIYGYIKADAVYESQVTAPKGDFAFWVLPEVAGEEDGQTRIGARESRLGLNVAGPDFGNWKPTGKLEMDFYGGDKANSYNPRMRLAYLDLANASGLSFRMGQDWETFCEVTPRIVNFAYLADIGALGLRRPQFRATQELKFTDNTKLVLKAAIAQTVGEDLDGAGYEDGADAELPSAQWNVTLHQKLWAEKPARVSFAGHYGQETVDAAEEGVIVENDATDYDTWSVQGSIFLPLTKCLAAQANLWQGANLDTYYGGIGQGVNVALDTEIEAIGGWAQLLWDPTEKVAMGLGYSVDDPEDEDLSAGMRSKNEQVFVCAFYKLSAAVTAMGEYARMTTDYLEGDDVSSDRVQLSMKYTF